MASMTAALLLATLVQADLTRNDEEYDYGEEPPFKLAGLLLSAQALRTDFDEVHGLDDGKGVMAEAHLRLGEIYYYRVAGFWWETEEDLPGRPVRDVDVRAGVVGMGMDWLFGAFPNVALDGGVGVGVMEYDSGVQSEKGFYLQFETALSLRPVPYVGLRFSLFGDYTNLHFNTAETEHGLNLSAGAGLELKF